MHSWKSRLRSTFVAAVILAPASAPAQTVANSFDDLRQVLKKGQTVVVTDTSGRQTKGKVADTSPSSLVILIPETRTFTEGSVREIRATDSLRNGALLGAGIGTAFATWDYLIDPSEPGNAVIFAVGIGMGAAIGAGIDALLKGGGVLYRSPQQARLLTISPFAGKDRQGVRVSVRF